MTDEPLPIHQALAAVMAEVPAVPKMDRNQGQGFDFRGIDSLLNALGPALRKHGVVPLPTCLSSEFGLHVKEERKGQQVYEKVTYYARVVMRYDFVGPMGDSLSVTTIGESFDSFDKASTKAMSQAYKYALVQTFALPTHEPDPDSENPEPTERRQRPARPSAQQDPAPAPNTGPEPPEWTLPMRHAFGLMADDEDRKQAKLAFSAEFGCGPEGLAKNQVMPAWRFIASAVGVTAHPFQGHQNGKCEVCGGMEACGWHRNGTAQPPQGAQEPSEPAAMPEPPSGAQERPWWQLSGPEFDAELAAAPKPELVKAADALGVPSDGTVAVLRERLAAAVAPM